MQPSNALNAFFYLLKVYYHFGNNVRYEGKSREKVVALTFDDGPHPVDDEGLLDVLDKHEVKATFFLCGKHVKALPYHALEIKKRGHEIGNHSFSHGWSVTLPRSISRVRREIVETNQLIREITGQSPFYFRPPRLVQGKKVARVLRDEGMVSILASAFTRDWKMQDDPDSIFKGVKKMVKEGAIIVLHSGDADHGALQQEPRKGTTAATDQLLSFLKGKGFEIGTVSDLLGKEGPPSD